MLKRLPSFRGFTLKTQSGASEKFKKGFTLIELLVVIAILGVLITFGINLWQRAVVNARDATREQDLNQFKTALELHFENNGTYPPSAVGDVHCSDDTGVARSISWNGIDPFRCDNITYMKILPVDPGNVITPNYCYHAEPAPAVGSTWFEIHILMENEANANTPEVLVSDCPNGTHLKNYILTNDP